MRRIIEIIVLAAVLAIPSLALASSNSMTNVTLAKGQSHNGTYYAAGSNVTVDGNVNGDVICAGQTVVVNGTVNGDVICAGQNITINGPVSGSVRVAGQSVSINGTIGRNATVVAQSLTFGSGATVSGDMALGGQSVSIGAPVTGGIYAAASSLSLLAPVGGDVHARVSDLSFGNGATIGGNLTYTSASTFTISKSQVKGSVVHNLPPARPGARLTIATWLGSLIYWILAALGGILLVIWLLPRFVRSITDAMLKRPGGSLGWGFVGIIGGPVALLVLAITVIGIPVALLTGALLLLAVLTSGAIAGVALGRRILADPTSDQRSLFMAALIGVPIVEIGLLLPWLGALVGILAAAWSVGGILLSLNRARRLA